MTVAQGINKITTIAKQSALGTPNVTASAGQILRRVSSVSQFDRNTFANTEIAPDQQDRGITYGLKKSATKFSGLLSPSTFKLWIAAALRKDFTAGVSTAGLALTIAGAGPTYTVARGAGSYLTDGFKIGDVIMLTVGGLNAANISKNLLITNLVAATATVIPVNGSSMVAEGPITGSTVSVVGKKSLAPLTGQTNDYFTVEEWYSDITKSDMFTDMKVNKVNIKLPATGNCTADFELVGLGLTTGTSQQMATPSAVTSTPICTAVNGDVYINGTQSLTCTGMNLSIDGGVALVEAVVGANSAIDLNHGLIKVSGSFMALLTDQVIQLLYNTESPVSLVFVASADQTAASAFMAFTMGRVKITSAVPDDGQKMLVRTFNFTAEINLAAGGAAATWDATILTIQDSAA